MDMYDEFKDLIAALNAQEVPYALCGGLAMAVYAFPRATIDIDVMLEESSLEKVKAIAGECGFNVDTGLMEFKKRTIRIHRLTKLDPELGDTLVLDLLLVTPEIRDVWDGRKTIAV